MATIDETMTGSGKVAACLDCSINLIGDVEGGILYTLNIDPNSILFYNNNCLYKDEVSEQILKNTMFFFREVKPFLSKYTEKGVGRMLLIFERTFSAKYGHTWLMTKVKAVKDDIQTEAAQPIDDVSERRFLIHPGNFAKDTRGCFIPTKLDNLKHLNVGNEANLRAIAVSTTAAKQDLDRLVNLGIRKLYFDASIFGA